VTLLSPNVHVEHAVDMNLQARSEIGHADAREASVMHLWSFTIKKIIRQPY